MPWRLWSLGVIELHRATIILETVYWYLLGIHELQLLLHDSCLLGSYLSPAWQSSQISRLLWTGQEEQATCRPHGGRAGRPICERTVEWIRQETDWENHEAAQRLKKSLKDLSLVPCTHNVAHLWLQFQGMWQPPLTSKGISHTCDVHAYMQVNTNIW